MNMCKYWILEISDEGDKNEFRNATEIQYVKRKKSTKKC